MKLAALAALVLLTSVAATRAQPAPPAQIDRGHAVYERWCEPCHAPAPATGPAPPGTGVLMTRYKGTATPAAIADRTDLDFLTIKTFVRNGINSMPPARKTEISDADLVALAAFINRPKP